MKLDLTEDEIDEIREGIDTTDIDISLADTCSQDIPSPPVVEQEVKEEPHESSCSEGECFLQPLDRQSRL